jgi:hypothetical protein
VLTHVEEVADHAADGPVLLDRPVEVRLLSSIIQGNERGRFLIRVDHDALV